MQRTSAKTIHDPASPDLNLCLYSVFRQILAATARFGLSFFEAPTQ